MSGAVRSEVGNVGLYTQSKMSLSSFFVEKKLARRYNAAWQRFDVDFEKLVCSSFSTSITGEKSPVCTRSEENWLVRTDGQVRQRTAKKNCEGERARLYGAYVCASV